MTALLAEFKEPGALLEAATRTRAEGLRILDAFTPFPVEGLDEVLGLKDQRINWLGFAGLALGALLGWLLQWYPNTDYPLNIGGRPTVAPPSFTVLTFEFAVFLAALFMFFGLLFLNGLPKLHHPLFAVPRFELATGDRYFLMVDVPDQASRRFVEALHPESVAEVEA